MTEFNPPYTTAIVRADFTKMLAGALEGQLAKTWPQVMFALERDRPVPAQVRAARQTLRDIAADWAVQIQAAQTVEDFAAITMRWPSDGPMPPPPGFTPITPGAAPTVEAGPPPPEPPITAGPAPVDLTPPPEPPPFFPPEVPPPPPEPPVATGPDPFVLTDIPIPRPVEEGDDGA